MDGSDKGASRGKPGQPSIFANPPRRNPIANDVMAFTLRNLGFDPASTTATAAPSPDTVAKALARRDWIMEATERQRRLAPLQRAIPRVEALSPDVFLDQFYAPGRPVVIENAIGDWPALALWSPAYLRDRIGAAPVDYQDGRNDDPDFELYKDRHTRRVPFARYIDAVIDRAMANDAYITAYNSAANRAAFAPLQRDLGQIELLTPGEGMMWIGPPGTFTPLHFDLTNNLLAQVVGRKRLVLVPPSETSRMANDRHVFSEVHDIEDPARLIRFPLARDALRFEVEIGSGDLLYIPVGWWHQVRAVDFSVTLTYTNFLWPNDAHATFPA